MLHTAALAIAALALTVTGQHLDQSTEETGSFRNMPQGKMWQVRACFKLLLLLTPLTKRTPSFDFSFLLAFVV